MSSSVDAIPPIPSALKTATLTQIQGFQNGLETLAYGHVFSPCDRTLGTLFSIVTICAVATIAFMLIMSFSGHITNNLSQDLLRFVHTIDPIKLTIGLGTVTLLIGGALFVIYRVRHRVDPVIGSNFAHLPKEKDILQIVFEYYSFNKKKNNWTVDASYGYIDQSTLRDGNKKAYVYAFKPCDNHYSISTGVTLAAPFYAISALAYDAIRLAVIPFYIIGCLAIEKCLGRSLFEKEGQRRKERKFELKDIPLELGKSLFRIVKAPFYGTAFFFASFYTLINPAAGRTLAAAIERDWNEDVSRAEGFWSVQGRQELWDGIEGGGGPKGLGRTGFYLAGCWQPIGVIEFHEDHTVSGSSLSEAIAKGRGHAYLAIHTKDSTLVMHKVQPA